eukprot:TRINITY_DN11271_c0_g1_i2.p1 TRINITY_DN11271_c0_g1~~TRINITY_DN11271_c0_g1_i2.p1  ORF type:complete len:712 (+),score=173.66 TRINITY_DN11271_c0_g1_i2:976-3111(+)
MSDEIMCEKGRNMIRNVISECEDIQGCLNIVSALQSNLDLNQHVNELTFVDILGVSRPKVHRTLFLKMKEACLARIPKLSQEKLLQLLDETWKYADFEKLRPVTLSILEHIESLPSQYIEPLQEQPWFNELDIRVKRTVWEVSSQALMLAIKQPFKDYGEDKAELELSLEFCPLRENRETPEVRRRKSKALQALVNVVGDSNIIYNEICELVRESFESFTRTGALRPELLLACNPNLPQKDPLAMLTTLLDKVATDCIITHDNHAVLDKILEEFPTQLNFQGSLANRVEHFNKFLSEVLRRIEKKDERDVFQNPVEKIVPTYRDIIKKPMDFYTMKKKIRENEYANMKLFEMDLKLIWDNCIQYNTLTHTAAFIKLAKDMEIVANEETQRARQHLMKNTELKVFLQQKPVSDEDVSGDGTDMNPLLTDAVIMVGYPGVINALLRSIVVYLDQCKGKKSKDDFLRKLICVLIVGLDSDTIVKTGVFRLMDMESNVQQAHYFAEFYHEIKQPHIQKGLLEGIIQHFHNKQRLLVLLSKVAFMNELVHQRTEKRKDYAIQSLLKVLKMSNLFARDSTIMDGIYISLIRLLRRSSQACTFHTKRFVLIDCLLNDDIQEAEEENKLRCYMRILLTASKERLLPEPEISMFTHLSLLCRQGCISTRNFAEYEDFNQFAAVVDGSISVSFFFEEEILPIICIQFESLFHFCGLFYGCE